MTKPRTEAGAVMRWLNSHVGYTGGDCLTFPYYRNPNGYGIMWVDGRREGAHRFMCQLVHGVPPTSEHEAAHSCGKGHLGCVNPIHLRWATPKENQADRVVHGTQVTIIGESNGRAKLTAQDVSDIKEIIDRGAATAKALAKQYGVHPSTISLAIRGKNWSHLATQP